MDSETENLPNSSPHIKLHANLQRSIGPFTLNPSDTRARTSLIESPEFEFNSYVYLRTTKKKSRRVAGDRRRQRLRTRTRMYRRLLRAQIQLLTRENERFMEIENARIAAKAAGLKVRLKRSVSPHF